MNRGRIVVQIIFLFGQPQAALHDLQQVHFAVLDIRTDVETEIASDALAHHTRHHRKYILAVANGLNGLQIGLDGGESVLVLLHAIHHDVIQVSYLLRQRPFGLLLCGKPFNQSAQLCVIVLNQLFERAETGIFRREGIGLPPPATSIVIKIIARLDRQIHVFRVNAGLQTGLRLTSHGKGRQRHE